MQAAFALNTDTCQNIIAPDATVANVGANKQLSYVILPGQGIDTTITADIADFEMDAVTINAIKMNLNISIDTDGLKAQVGEITDAVGQVNDGAAALSDGSAQLYSATGTLNHAVGQLNSGTKPDRGRRREPLRWTFDPEWKECRPAEWRISGFHRAVQRRADDAEQ